MNTLTYIKAGHRYVFVYDDKLRSVNRVMRQLVEFVDDDELDFTATDARIIAEKLKARHGTA